MSHTQTVRLDGCVMQVDYTWDNANNELGEIEEITLIENTTIWDVLMAEISAEMIETNIAENHVNEEPFEE